MRDNPNNDCEGDYGKGKQLVLLKLPITDKCDKQVTNCLVYQ